MGNASGMCVGDALMPAIKVQSVGLAPTSPSTQSSVARTSRPTTAYWVLVSPHPSITSPATKTVETVGAKNTARVTVTAQVRTYAQAIANNPGVHGEIANCELKIWNSMPSICNLQ